MQVPGLCPGDEEYPPPPPWALRHLPAVATPLPHPHPHPPPPPSTGERVLGVSPSASPTFSHARSFRGVTVTVPSRGCGQESRPEPLGESPGTPPAKRGADAGLPPGLGIDVTLERKHP